MKAAKVGTAYVHVGSNGGISVIPAHLVLIAVDQSLNDLIVSRSTEGVTTAQGRSYSMRSYTGTQHITRVGPDYSPS
jgi:hypothetical protein